MTGVSDTLLERVAAAAERDPATVRPVLQVLAGEVPDRVSMLRPVAERVNAERLRAALEEFRDGAWTTDDVLRHIRRFRTRQAVHALRARGRLLGRTIGNATWFPRWQFADGDLRPDLGKLLDTLGRFSTDAVACDRVMRLPRPELHGRSIAEALDRPRDQRLAWRVLGAVGGAD
jgi:hypothetical protein